MQRLKKEDKLCIIIDKIKERKYLIMTLMQEQAMDLIKKMSDEKIYYLINLLKDFVETTPISENELTNSQKAYENLQKFRRVGIEDIDYKKELYSALEENHENVAGRY